MKPRKRERDIRPGDDLLERDGNGWKWSIRLASDPKGWEYDLQYALTRIRRYGARVVRSFADRSEFVA